MTSIWFVLFVLLIMILPFFLFIIEGVKIYKKRRIESLILFVLAILYFVFLKEFLPNFI